MSDEASDLSAAVAGDGEAFARLYQRHAGVVLSLCRRYATLGEAEDAMQETFLRAYRKLDQLKRPEGLRSWLYAIARRVCSEGRRTARRRDRHENLAARNHLKSMQTTEPFDQALGRAEQLERLGMALDRLADNERLAIHLHYLDPDPPEAARAVLGVSRTGFYRLLTRARDRLAASMQEAQTT